MTGWQSQFQTTLPVISDASDTYIPLHTITTNDGQNVPRATSYLIKLQTGLFIYMYYLQ